MNCFACSKKDVDFIVPGYLYNKEFNNWWGLIRNCQFHAQTLNQNMNTKETCTKYEGSSKFNGIPREGKPEMLMLSAWIVTGPSIPRTLVTSLAYILYFWFHILSLGNSEVQVGYRVYQENLCVWLVFNTTIGDHTLWVFCAIGCVWIPRPCIFKVVGTYYRRGKVSIPSFSPKVIHWGNLAVVQQGSEASWI